MTKEALFSAASVLKFLGDLIRCIGRAKILSKNGLASVKLPTTSTADTTKKLDAREYLTSWKEIAEYMRLGVRTVQRYEREFGLPIRRPTGKSRGSVIATRAEIDAWIAVSPIHKTFTLSRTERDLRTEETGRKLIAGMREMRDLKNQMLALRTETRNALNVLVDRVSSLRFVMPSSRALGYRPLVNMDEDTLLYADEAGPEIQGTLPHLTGHHKSSGPRRNRTSPLSSKKPH